MLKKVAGIVFAIVVPMAVFAAQKGREPIEVKVITSKTEIHGNHVKDVFSYTSVMFTEVNGMHVVYKCVQKGDLCPLMDAGETYTADRVGDFIYIAMSFPDEKRPIPVKYKEAGSW